MAIPPELLREQSLITVLLLLVCGALWRLYITERQGRDADNRTHADTLLTVRVDYERASATIDLRMSERDAARREHERCLTEVDRLRERIDGMGR